VRIGDRIRGRSNRWENPDVRAEAQNVELPPTAKRFSAILPIVLILPIGHTVYATVYGTLAVAAVQGTLGGLMFWWLGLPAPLLWGLVMGVLAVLPVLGAFIVWIPAALFLALDGSWGKALILALWGGVVVDGIDNVMIYPILVGNRLKLHTIPAFMAIVGGLIVFGPSGLILGPVALTVTVLLLEIWQSRTP
jgi:predicted PurR-regulated permease PerM